MNYIRPHSADKNFVLWHVVVPAETVRFPVGISEDRICRLEGCLHGKAGPTRIGFMQQRDQDQWEFHDLPHAEYNLNVYRFDMWYRDDDVWRPDTNEFLESFRELRASSPTDQNFCSSCTPAKRNAV